MISGSGTTEIDIGDSCICLLEVLMFSSLLTLFREAFSMSLVPLAT